MKKHGNSKNNNKPHHLYEIRDKTDDDIFKYGISDNRIGKDGLSKRIRTQTSFLNLAVGWVRYFAKILIRNIPGREKAQKIEDEFIESYREKHGRKPRGNLKGGK